MIPECFHMMLDEAYGSIGGNQHLTPFTRSQLIKARAVSDEKYQKMKAFNNLLSSQRITIERAFGMFIRKWGILWKPLEFKLQTNVLIVTVCAKLHNVSINYWKRKGKLAEEISAMDRNYDQQRDVGMFMGWGAANGLFAPQEDIMEDENIAHIMGNHIRNDGLSLTCSMKVITQD